MSDFRGGEFGVYNSEVLGTNGLIHGPMMKTLKLGRGEECERGGMSVKSGEKSGKGKARRQSEMQNE